MSYKPDPALLERIKIAMDADFPIHIIERVLDAAENMKPTIRRRTEVASADPAPAGKPDCG